jgi:TP901 family phage tail tape measure protein
MARASATTRSFGVTASGVGTSMQNAGSKMNQVGNKMTLGYSLPMIMAGKHAIDTAVDFSRSMNTMAAVAQVPGPELEKLRQLAIRLGEDTVFSANEAAQAEVELAKAGVSTADIMGGALKNTLDLATAGDLDLATAATIAANAMNIFELGGKKSKVAVDALAGAANASSADVYDLAEALANGGTVAKQLDLTVQETTAAMAAFADQGVKGGEAGTGFKSMMLAVASPTAKQTEMMKDLNLSFFDAQGNFIGLAEMAGELKTKLAGLTQQQRLQALATIFGSYGQRQATILMREGEEGIRRYTRATSAQGAAAKVAEGKMKGLPGVMEELSGSIETAVLQIGEEELAEMVTDIAEGIQDAIKAFRNLSPEMRSTSLSGRLTAWPSVP